jgi:hypothetical protein
MEWEQDFSLQVVASRPRLGLLRLVQCAPPPTPRSRRQRRVQVAPSRSLRVALVQVVEAAGHSPAAEGPPAAGQGASPTSRRGQVGSGAPLNTGAERCALRSDRAERARVQRQSTWRQLGGREQVVGELFLPLRALESGAPRKRSARARPSVAPPETAPVKRARCSEKAEGGALGGAGGTSLQRQARTKGARCSGRKRWRRWRGCASRTASRASQGATPRRPAPRLARPRGRHTGAAMARPAPLSPAPDTLTCDRRPRKGTGKTSPRLPRPAPTRSGLSPEAQGRVVGAGGQGGRG